MPNNKVLFIVEGLNDEAAFIRRLLNKCGWNTEYEIYPYRCNIHVLAQILHDEYPGFENDEIDIQLVLKSIEGDKSKRRILDQKYRDVILVFDFEPHHDFPHFDTVRRMLAYFNDSSDRGKLYINYPMMQSYKHFSLLPDDSFKDRVVSLDNCLYYKRIVGQESNYTDINKYTYITFISMIVHHIRKANLVLTGEYRIPLADEFISWNGLDIFDVQVKRVKSGEDIFVLNTSVFIIIDLAPHRFFNMVLSRKDEFSI